MANDLKFAHTPLRPHYGGFLTDYAIMTLPTGYSQFSTASLGTDQVSLMARTSHVSWVSQQVPDFKTRVDVIGTDASEVDGVVTYRHETMPPYESDVRVVSSREYEIEMPAVVGRIVSNTELYRREPKPVAGGVIEIQHIDYEKDYSPLGVEPRGRGITESCPSSRRTSKNSSVVHASPVYMSATRPVLPKISEGSLTTRAGSKSRHRSQDSFSSVSRSHIFYETSSSAAVVTSQPIVYSTSSTHTTLTKKSRRTK